MGITIILLNGATNPVLNYLHLIHDVSVFMLEFLVVVCELVPIKFVFDIPWRDALMCSILINSVSYLAGMVFYSLK